MPDFLGWHQDKKTGEPQALVQLNSRVFKPHADGSMTIVQEPKTQPFTGEQIAKMSQIAGPNSQGFWKNLENLFAARMDIHHNGQDMSLPSAEEKPPRLAAAPRSPAPGLTMG